MPITIENTQYFTTKEISSMYNKSENAIRKILNRLYKNDQTILKRGIIRYIPNSIVEFLSNYWKIYSKNEPNDEPNKTAMGPLWAMKNNRLNANNISIGKITLENVEIPSNFIETLDKFISIKKNIQNQSNQIQSVETKQISASTDINKVENIQKIRDRINEIIRDRCEKNSLLYQNIWNAIYCGFNDKYNINLREIHQNAINSKKMKKGASIISTIADIDIIEKFYNFVDKEFSWSTYISN